MHHSYGRKWEVREQPIEFLPIQFSLAVAAAEPPTPGAMNQKAKLLQRLSVTCNSVIRIVSPNFRKRPAECVLWPLIAWLRSTLVVISAPEVNYGEAIRAECGEGAVLA